MGVYGIPPIRYLRKSTALLAGIILAFVVHRTLAEFGDEPKRSVLPVPPVAVKSELCRNIVGGAPFGIDSSFTARRMRVYVVSSWKGRLSVGDDTLHHVWYREGEKVRSDACLPDVEPCISSLEPELLAPGAWSVDLVNGRRLLSSRQFLVQDEP